jgi:hypothetical protein
MKADWTRLKLTNAELEKGLLIAVVVFIVVFFNKKEGGQSQLPMIILLMILALIGIHTTKDDLAQLNIQAVYSE